uniref:Uncharacterized protein n=1 Tax=Anguilla anguilla TaxID=7936 RepID=A0A0E9XNJ4_ANGAN
MYIEVLYLLVGTFLWVVVFGEHFYKSSDNGLSIHLLLNFPFFLSQPRENYIYVIKKLY